MDSGKQLLLLEKLVQKGLLEHSHRESSQFIWCLKKKEIHKLGQDTDTSFGYQ